MTTLRHGLFLIPLALAAVCALDGLALRWMAVSEVGAAAGDPIALVTPTTRDLGIVRVGGTVEVPFELRNAGRRRLILRELNGGCDCLAAAQPEVVVQPRATRKLIVRLDTRKAFGPLKLESRYKTNDPNRRILTLVVLVNIQRP